MSEAKKDVRFFFAFNSPFAFLASTRLEEALEGCDVQVVGEAVYAARSGPPPSAADSSKFAYIEEDSRRWGQKYGLKLNPGPFADSRPACLGYYEAERHGRALEYRRAVFAARHLEAGDIGNPKLLVGVAKSLGLDTSDFSAAIQGTAHESRLNCASEARSEAGAFGFPFFVFEGQRFWGNDRIEWLVEAVKDSKTA